MATPRRAERWREHNSSLSIDAIGDWQAPMIQDGVRMPRRRIEFEVYIDVGSAVVRF